MKKSKNVYEGLEFEERPYDQNGKFSVYIPKSNDAIMELIQRERQKSNKMRELTKTSGGFRPPAHQQLQQQQQQQQQPDAATSNTQNNKVKQKLMFDIQAARELDADNFHQATQSLPMTMAHRNIQNFAGETEANLFPATTKNLQSNSEHINKDHHPQLYKSVNFSDNMQNSQRQGSAVNLRNSSYLNNIYNSQSSLRAGTTVGGKRYRPHFKELPDPSQSGKSLTKSQTQSVGFSQILQKEKMIRQLTKQLYFDERTKTVPKTTVKNQIIENIIQDGEIFLEKKELLNSIYKLKQLNLLQENQTSIQKLRANNKFGFVYNDFHTKATNNGFSRQPVGGYFFTR